MVIKEINGNLLDTEAKFIFHQVNCKGKMGSGVAKAIRDKYPEVFEVYDEYYTEMIEDLDLPTSTVLGVALGVNTKDGKKVYNLFGQDSFGYDGRKYTSYDALDKAMKEVAKNENLDGETIALPYNMGACRGGGDWNVILAIIKSVFANINVTIEIWRLDLG